MYPTGLFARSRRRASRAAPRRICRDSPTDAYAGFNTVYKPERKPGPIIEAACWAHARRKFFELADIASMLERSINGSPPQERLAARRGGIAPLVNDLINWRRQERAKLPRHNDGLHAQAHRCLHALSR
jgi:transposase